VSADTASVALTRGRALLDIGRPEEAADAFRAAIAAEPAWAEPRGHLGWALVSAGEPEAALEALKGALALAPDAGWLHRTRAYALAMLDRTKEAVEAAEIGARADPTTAQAHEVLADMRLAAGDARGARQAAEAARELDPDQPGPHISLGDVALEQDRYPEAEGHYRAALALDAENTHALYNLGAALHGQSRRDEAREAFERVALLDPHDEHSRKALAGTTRGYVNGVWMFIAAFIAFRAIAGLIEGEEPGLAAGIGLVALAIFGVAVVQRRRRMATLSSGAQRLLADQKWHQKIELSRWRPWFWLIPSTIWFSLGVLVMIGFVVAAATGSTADWELGDYLVIAAIAAITALCGRAALIRVRRRGRWF
jgi:tetratricopeptide (TPR) repeat protein